MAINISNDLTDFTSSEVNTLLTNNLNKYHPLLLYVSSFTLILSLVVVNVMFELPFKFLAIKNLTRYLDVSYYLFGVSFTALFLGSW